MALAELPTNPTSAWELKRATMPGTIAAKGVLARGVLISEAVARSQCDGGRGPSDGPLDHLGRLAAPMILPCLGGRHGGKRGPISQACAVGVSRCGAGQAVACGSSAQALAAAPAATLAASDACAFLFGAQARAAPPAAAQAAPDACAFLFGADACAVAIRRRPCAREAAARQERGPGAALLALLGADARCSPSGAAPPVRLVLLQQVASLMPAALAAHYGLLAGAAGAPPIAAACMPLPVLFSVPPVGPNTWLANKRARAFHRACIVCVYAQGAFAVLKFARGDLIGGVYDAVMCAMGAYACEPDGIRLMPSYITICAFNGALGLLQMFQQFHGMPVAHLPLLMMVPPAVAIAAAYCGWQFCKEIRAISAGYAGEGAQDSCFVRVMGGDWWPSSLGASVTGVGGHEDAGGGLGFGSASNFNPFGGDGHRLGSQ